MPALTSREQLLILTVLAAVLLGAAVKHWRDVRREAPAPAHPAAVGRSRPFIPS